MGAWEVLGWIGVGMLVMNDSYVRELLKFNNKDKE